MAETDAPVKFFEIPDKHASDKKDYKYVVLANGLKVLLVSDNKTDCNVAGDDASSNLKLEEQFQDEKPSAVALMVDVGSFEQPRKFQGLAHFVQHMIFMGSKKYPEENAFDKYITKCGNYHSAYTKSEETVYFFETPEEHLDSVMDYFVAQLKEPLLMADSMTRAREALELKYQTYVNLEHWRRDHLLQSLANENYPHYNFTLGNLISLKEDIENDHELHDNVLEFYKRHYSGHRMFACIQSGLTLQELEALAIKHFADISSNWLPGHDFSQYNYKQAFEKQFYEEVLFFKSIENVCKLDLTWVLPSTLKLYKCKPCKFVSGILSNAGKGSLCAYLRKRLWASGVNAIPESNSVFTLFSLTINLTALGLKHLDEVLEVTFSYIKLLNKASDLKEFYQEVSFMKDISFPDDVEAYPDQNVQGLVTCCRYYPTKDILTGDEIYFSFNENEVQNLLDHLNVFNFNIMLTTANGYEDEVYDKKEKWFGTEYTSRKIPEKWLELWNNRHSMPELHLPEANLFIPQDFRIFWIEDGRQNLHQFPEKVMQNERFKLWFRQDNKFLLPRGYMHFHFISPLLRKSCKNSVLCALYTAFIEHHLKGKLYPASQAGIFYRVLSSEKGVTLLVHGHNEKLHLVVEIVIKALISTKELITESELELLKKKLQESSFNKLMDAAVVNMDLMDHILMQKHWLLMEKYKHISDVKLTEIQLFAEEFTQELYVEALIQGNLRQQTACSVMSTVMEYLNCSEIKEKYLMEERATEIPLGSHKILCHNLNSKYCMSSISNFYQIGQRSLRNECILNLIIMILETPLNNTLRTEQELGYDVDCSLKITCGIMGYLIRVTSDKTEHSASYVEQCIDEFHQSIQTILSETSLKDFENVKDCLITQRQYALLSDTLGLIYQEEVTTEEYLFQRIFMEIETLQKIEKQDILDFWRKNETENFRKLSIQVMSFKATEKEFSGVNNEAFNDDFDLKFMDLDQDGTAINNVQEFKENLHVYPVIKTKLS